MASAAVQQLPGLFGAEPGGEDQQRANAGPAALLGDGGYGGGRDGEHREIRNPGERSDGRVRRLARDRVGGGVDRPGGTGESAVPDPVQDSPADRSLPAGDTDHGDRGRAQQRGEAGHVGPAPPFVDSLAVVLVGLVQGDPDPDLALFVAAPDGKAEVREDLVHGAVAGQGVGLEEAHPALPGGVDQVFQEECGNTPVVPVVGDHQGQFRGLRRLVQQLAVRFADEYVADPGSECQQAVARRPAQAVGGRPGCGAADAEEAHPPALVREAGGVEAEDGLPVVGRDRADPDGGPVGEQSRLGPGARDRSSGHGSLLGPSSDRSSLRARRRPGPGPTGPGGRAGWECRGRKRPAAGTGFRSPARRARCVRAR